MAESAHIEERTEQFIREYKRLKEASELPDNKTIAESIGITSASALSNILAKRQNIQPMAWQKFRSIYLKYQGGEGLENSKEKSTEKEKEMSPGQLMSILARAYEAQAKTLEIQIGILDTIQKEMARKDIQAIIDKRTEKMEFNLKEVYAGLQDTFRHQEESMRELRDLLSKKEVLKNSLSLGAGKKQDQIHDEEGKRNKSPG